MIKLHVIYATHLLIIIYLCYCTLILYKCQTLIKIFSAEISSYCQNIITKSK